MVFCTKKGFSISETLGFVTTQKQFAWSALLFGKKKLVYALRYLCIMFFFIEPAYMQHMYMSSDPSQAKKVFLYAGIIGFFITLCCLLAGGVVAEWIPSDVSRKYIFNYIMGHVSPLLKGALCICLLALTMSTADSRLHICAVMIYDILPILFRARFRENVSCTDHYRIAYVSILVIAMLAIVLSLNSPYLSMIGRMTNWLHDFYIPIVVAPFILAVLGFRSSSPAALIGMATGALAVVVWPKWIYPLLRTTSNGFPCVLVNGLTMLAVHYVWPRSREVPIQQYGTVTQNNKKTPLCKAARLKSALLLK
ncbi:MAG: hypothetical protein NMK33_02350 [Candidatus Cardinium sp.]|uniref:hypothetical protein n=1 Tax=Cardinium endosymbiont of Dermatophagoides farinae TaxID=2597823 RepID=UPI001181CD85|nr:hypothetical protein [Cardinium endosymbiont of Dermatophagoides farinae]TSJ81319.1 hypothetical protein FPG78_05010 [Cardinium endosymbiont of Dermatophagoides farinae]UWW97383.1 MAG: hypothetical protein NMK33_02350 [Candidatus Cardinium sp.]